MCFVSRECETDETNETKRNNAPLRMRQLSANPEIK
jgi:hypothetical protein